MNKLSTVFLVVMMGLTLLAGSARADVLLDHGHQSGVFSPSYAVQNSNFEYQSFQVTDAEGWTVSTIGLWSGLVQDDQGVGMRGLILADNAGAPDESSVIAEQNWTMTGNIFTRTLDHQSYNLYLPAGAYWLACLPGGTPDDQYVCSIGAGTSGPAHWFNNGAGTTPEVSPGGKSLALIIEGSIGQDPVATDLSSWDKVKSLYR